MANITIFGLKQWVHWLLFYYCFSFSLSSHFFPKKIWRGMEVLKRSLRLTGYITESNNMKPLNISLQIFKSYFVFYNWTANCDFRITMYLTFPQWELMPLAVGKMSHASQNLVVLRIFTILHLVKAGFAILYITE